MIPELPDSGIELPPMCPYGPVVDDLCRWPQFIENVGHSRSDSDCLAAPDPFNHAREIDRG